MLKFVPVLLFFASVKDVLCKIQCMDQNNNPVDWYVVFKHPKIESSEGYVSKGESFMYMTSETLDQGWTWSSIGIQDSNTLLANTLRPFYSNTSQGLWILYNDEKPVSEDWDDTWVDFGGHTKGVVGADEDQGIWLVHSVPKYPPQSAQGYGYPHTGLVYGQSALCLTLTPQSLNTVGRALGYNDPDIYDSRIESKLTGLYPELEAALARSNRTSSPWFLRDDLETVAGASFTVFAKANNFGKDLYDLVASQLEADLLVETWQNEEDPLPSSCHTPFQILNIKGIAMKDRELYFRSSKDHSKWAIGTHEIWTCIGDINRAGPQEKRGGGTVCVNNQQLWNHYRLVVDRVEDCKTKRRHHKHRFI